MEAITLAAHGISKCAFGNIKTGWAPFTQKRLPIKLVYCEYYDRVEDAYRREKQVQGLTHHKKQALIEDNKDKLVEYSRNYTQYEAHRLIRK